ncbi:MAG: hypothetical protein IKU89_02350 [Oscillospiraceae bacterium]|nr:hypothetical protein [Oscillospiraceae bacterium]
MKTNLRKIYFIGVSLTIALCAIGMLLTVIWYFMEVNSTDNNFFFSEIVSPYNAIVLATSFVPIIPVFAIIFIISDIINKSYKNAFKVFASLCITVIAWVLYVFTFVGLTGGV